MASNLVVPSNVNWESLKGHSLEECTYWLLEAIGAKEIDWRIGGSGGGAADGGRDLECMFNIPHPSGDVFRQRWWVEVKGRSSTVSPSVVKESIHSIAGNSDVDVHLIVTNQQLSNPTKDWITEWKKSHPRPDIRIWERQDLERLVSRNPIVAIRLFPKSLSPQGLCDALSTRFWDYVTYSDVPTLRILWHNREEIEWNDRSYFAAITSECANGNLSSRPWGCLIPDDRLIRIYLNALVNSFYLMFRADAAGVRSEPVTEALSHLLILLVAKFDPEVVAKITQNFADFSEDLADLPLEARRLIFDPIVHNACAQIGRACLSDCIRVFGNSKVMSKEEAEEYWKRYRPPAKADENEESENEEPSFHVESYKGACNAGLNLSKDHTCPLTNFDALGETIENKLTALRPVIVARTGLRPANKD